MSNNGITVPIEVTFNERGALIAVKVDTHAVEPANLVGGKMTLTLSKPIPPPPPNPGCECPNICHDVVKGSALLTPPPSSS